MHPVTAQQLIELNRRFYLAFGGAFAAIPDMRIELVTLFHCGDWAATEWNMSGSYSSNFPGFPQAAGRHFSVRGASIMELHAGRISATVP